MDRLRPHWPTFRLGVLMHLTFGAVILAVAVVAGPPLAWLVGESLVSAVLAITAVTGRAIIGHVTARILWTASAHPSLALSTAVGSALVGYAAIFLPLAFLGAVGSTGLTSTGLPAGLAITLDGILTMTAAASGALIAARTKRRYRRKLVVAHKLPLVREISESFADHRARARLNT